MKLRRRNRIIGRKVEILHNPTHTQLRSRFGKVVEIEPYNDDYLLILLDSPAIWIQTNGKREDQEKLYILKDNLKFL